MVGKGWTDDWGEEGGSRVSFCQLVLGLLLFLALAFYLFIYYYCYVVCFFFEFILNNLIQHQFYGFAATPAGLSAGRG